MNHRLKEVLVERRINAPSAQQNGFDYTKFFDFGFFSNAGASFAGAPHPASQNANKENSYIFDIQKQIDPNTLYLHKTVIPRTQQASVVPEVFSIETFKRLRLRLKTLKPHTKLKSNKYRLTNFIGI